MPYRKNSYIPIMFERLNRICEKFGIHLYAAVIRKQDPIPLLFNSGVYEIPIQLNNGMLTSCIGKTMRWL